MLAHRPLQPQKIRPAEAEDRYPLSLLHAELIEGASDTLSLSVEADVAERLLFEMDRSLVASIRSVSVDQAAEIQRPIHAPHARILRFRRNPELLGEAPIT
ncbi:hypothetical protein GGD63_005806 [Bradyrhizobium sp. cir1]|nr:hypothetical protein [Bradyrhizobium sp. cir1]